MSRRPPIRGCPMQFGLFGGARTKRSVGLGGQPGLRELHRVRHRSRPAGLQAAVHGRAPLHRPGPGVGVDDGARLSRRAHRSHPARHRGGGAAVAQSGADRRAGRDARPAERRPASISASARATARPSSTASASRIDEATERFDEAMEIIRKAWTHRGPLQPSRQALALREHRGRARAVAAPSPAAVARRRQPRQRSDAPRARATTCCSTSWRRPTRSSSASRSSARNASGSAARYDPLMVATRAAAADDPSTRASAPPPTRPASAC